MNRDKLIKLKEKALDQMILCASIFHGNKPPLPEHVREMQAHAALVSALCAELGDPLAPPSDAERDKLLEHAAANLQIALADPATRRDCLKSALEFVTKARAKGGPS